MFISYLIILNYFICFSNERIYFHIDL